eukprot:9486761-Pyramimonas_sp.AAC.1
MPRPCGRWGFTGRPRQRSQGRAAWRGPRAGLLREETMQPRPSVSLRGSARTPSAPISSVPQVVVRAEC